MHGSNVLFFMLKVHQVLPPPLKLIVTTFFGGIFLDFFIELQIKFCFLSGQVLSGVLFNHNLLSSCIMDANIMESNFIACIIR